MRKKVLIIAPFHRGIGGAETYLMGLMEEALKRFDVYLVSLAKPPDKWQGTPMGKVLGICNELYLDARKYKNIDTIDCHGLQAALVGVALKRHRKFKMCVTILALYDFKKRPWWFRYICRWVLNHADKIFVEGETGKKDLLDCGVREDKIVKFYHWIDIKQFKKIDRSSYGMRVLFVGRPIPIKGKHIIEEIERKLFYLKDLTFTYIENTPHKDLMKYYQAADVMVVPSQYSEGFPRVVFEAAACGCIIIASNRGALPELVEPFGQIFKSPMELKDMIEEHYNCSITRPKLQDRSRFYSEKYFTSKNAEVILNEY